MGELTITKNAIQKAIELSIPEVVKRKLTQSEFQIVSASIPSEKNLRIQDMSEEKRLRLASTIVLKAITRFVSREVDSRQQEILVDEVDSDLIRKFYAMTGLEVFKALEMGLDGELSNERVFHFTPAIFVIWVNTYKEHIKRPVLAKFSAMNKQPDNLEYVPTIEESMNSKFKVLESAVRQTIDGDTYQDYGGVVYSLLDELKMINLEASEKWQFMDKAKLTMLSEAQQSKDRTKVKSVMKILEEANENPKHEAVTTVATRLIIIDILTSLKVDEGDEFLESVKLKIEEHVNKLKDA